MKKCLPLTHQWRLVDTVGLVKFYNCVKCPAKKVRIKGKDKIT